MDISHETRLGPLRAEIDRIDDQILALVARRSDTARKVAACKHAEAGDVLKYRPRRHAEIIARLGSKEAAAPAGLVGAIWRELTGHALQLQARTEVVLYGTEEPTVLEARVRLHFGSATPITWATSAEEALGRARQDEAIAVIAAPLPHVSPPLRVCDTVLTERGSLLAHIVARVSSHDCVVTNPPRADRRGAVAAAPAAGWTPCGWRLRPARQMPAYPDREALAEIERRLDRKAPLTSVADIMLLRAHLARVASGEAFLLQGGDCAESFAEFNSDKVRATYTLLLRMGAMLRRDSGTSIVHLARIAGQFAKPRSTDTETIGAVTLPSYRGDAVNGMAFDPATRTPDPRRLLDAHRQAQATINLLKAYAGASYADLPAFHAEAGSPELVKPVPMFTSHEALLLNYEQALTRFDEATSSWWATSGHMIWIGDRTRALDGAHVEYARGVANPVGVKCGPSLQPDELMRLLDRLDPDNRPGRLVLIGRFGARKIGEHLPALMRATRRAGRKAVWSIDPMHGNTCTVRGFKTRLMSDILDEIGLFFAVARAEGIYPGGVHLEMTGCEVTECLGGRLNVAEEDLPKRYRTHCDPRLNRDQALSVAAAVGGLLRPAANPERCAA